MMKRVSSGADPDAITWSEWRDHMLFAPTTQVADLFRCVRKREDVARPFVIFPFEHIRRRHAKFFSNFLMPLPSHHLQLSLGTGP